MLNRTDIYKHYTSTAMLIGIDEARLTKWSLGYFAKNILPHLPDNKEARILEIGCGYGRNIAALKDLGYKNVCGMDISEEQVAYACEKLGLDNVKMDDALNYLKNINYTYNAVLLLDVLEHLDIGYSIELLELIWSSLEEGGVLIIQVPNAMAPLSPNYQWDLTHQRAYTTHSMEQNLRLSSFTKMKHFEITPHIHGIPSLIRRLLWYIALKPLIEGFMLVANSSRMGGIYTTNFLTVAYKEVEQNAHHNNKQKN